jgi:molybdenum cofactor cytidylyltransferase
MATPGAGVVLAGSSSSTRGAAEASLDSTSNHGRSSPPAKGPTLLDVVCATLTGGGVQPILVVVDQEAQDAPPAVPEECMAVPNPTPELGPVSSMALGLEAALQLGKVWALVALVDHPSAGVRTVRLLAERAANEPGAVHVPTYNGERGHPTAVPTALAPSLFEAQEGEGAREVFSRLGILVREHPVDDPGIVAHVGAPGDLHRLRSRR